jgi:hypothetical protein
MNDLNFAFRQLLKNPGFAIAAVLFLSAAESSNLPAQNAATAPSVPRSRPFRMGFTAFPHDITAEAVNQTRQFVRTNADLIAHHIEGVP